MELVKKNVINIICGVVILVALVSLIYPTGSMYSEFQTEVSKRKDVSEQLKKVSNAPREKPVGDINGKPEPLDVFPNPAVIAAGKQFVDTLHTQSLALKNDAIAKNRKGHDPLIPGILPNPNPTQINRFQQAYKEVTRPGGKPGNVLTPSPGSPLPENIPDVLLGSTPAPTDAQITAALAELWEKRYSRSILNDYAPLPPGSPPGQPPQLVSTNFPLVLAQFQNENRDFPKQFRDRRAATYKMYMEADALTLTQKIEQGATPAAEDIWYAQLGLWVQLDVIQAIKDMNKDSTNVARSPVKHLIKITLKDNLYETATPIGGAGGTPPAAGVAAAAVGEVVSYPISPTGRVCNQMYDVVQSTTQAVVDEKKVDQFLQMLQSGRLVNVLEVSQQKVDSYGARTLGYDYGDRPVVLVKVRCEHLFLRDWTARGPGAPMPDAVKKNLGVKEEPPPAAPGEGEPQPPTVANR